MTWPDNLPIDAEKRIDLQSGIYDRRGVNRSVRVGCGGALILYSEKEESLISRESLTVKKLMTDDR
jgi:hypothetical protein